MSSDFSSFKKIAVLGAVILVAGAVAFNYMDSQASAATIKALESQQEATSKALELAKEETGAALAVAKEQTTALAQQAEVTTATLAQVQETLVNIQDSQTEKVGNAFWGAFTETFKNAKCGMKVDGKVQGFNPLTKFKSVFSKPEFQIEHAGSLVE